MMETFWKFTVPAAGSLSLFQPKHSVVHTASREIASALIGVFLVGLFQYFLRENRTSLISTEKASLCRTRSRAAYGQLFRLKLNEAVDALFEAEVRCSVAGVAH